MNLLSISLVSFLLLDQVISYLTPFSSGLGLFIFLCVLFSRILIKNLLNNDIKFIFLETIKNPFSSKINFAVGILTGFSLLATSQAPCTSQLKFSLATIALIWVTIVVVKRYIKEFPEDKNIKSNHGLVGLTIVFIFLCLSIHDIDLISYIRDIHSNRPSGLYLEPSHLLLYSGPLIISVINDKNTRLIGITLTIFLFVLSYSATFAISVWLVILALALHSLHHKKPIYIRANILISLIITIFFALSLNPGYIQNRLNVVTFQNYESHTDKSVSSLVYLNGWLLAKSTLIHTKGLGLGLGSMGCSNTINENTETFSSAIKEKTKMNKIICVRDGSFLASKLISELGIIGLLFVTFIIFKIYKNTVESLENKFDLLSIGTTVLITILFFGRGLPYFSAPIIYCLFFLFVKKTTNQNS